MSRLNIFSMLARCLPAAVLLPVLSIQFADAAAEDLNDAAIVEAAYRTGPINSFMLQQDGELLVEAHRQGMRADRTTNVKSVSKSIVSLLVGIAIEQG